MISRHCVWYTAHTTYLTLRTDPVLGQVCCDIQTLRVVHSSLHYTPPTSHSGHTQSLGRSAVISRHRVWYTAHTTYLTLRTDPVLGQVCSDIQTSCVVHARTQLTTLHTTYLTFWTDPVLGQVCSDIQTPSVVHARTQLTTLHTTYLTFWTHPVLGQVCSDIQTSSVVHARTQLTAHHRPFFVTQPAKVVITIVLQEKEIIINS